MPRRLSLLAAVGLSLLSTAGAAQTEATYTVRLDATWSAATHPDDWPPSPHFSPLVGVTHDGAAALWRLGETASIGIERMAESGTTSTLTAEAAALGPAVRDVVVGPAIAVSPGAASLTITADESHAMLTLVTMIAPSPDWFVGVTGLALRDADGWRPSIVVDLFAIDAGTDSGLTYTAPNLDTQPKEPVTQITGVPFAPGGTLTRVGTLTVTRTGVAASESPDAERLVLRGPSPAMPGATWTVHSAATSSLQVDLYSVTGRRVSRLYDGPSGGTAQVALPPVAAGVYVLRAVQEGVPSTRLISIVR